MASKAVRDVLAKGFNRLVGRWPTDPELDDLVKRYEQGTGPLVKKAADSLRRREGSPDEQRPTTTSTGS